MWCKNSLSNDASCWSKKERESERRENKREKVKRGGGRKREREISVLVV